MKRVSLLVYVVVAMAVAVFSYQLGRKNVVSSEKEAVAAADHEPGSALPTGHPPLDTVDAGGQRRAGLVANAKFAHFEIGQRNVKKMYAEGDYLWIGTSGGAIRYQFSTDTYDVFDNKVPGILSNGVFYVGRVGEYIALGTYGGGLSLYDSQTDRWRNINIPQGLADQFVYDIEQTRSGDIWIATWSGVNRIVEGRLDDPAAWQTFTVENTHGGLPNPWVYGVEEGQDGEMWFATEGGLARYRNGTWTNWQHEDGLGAPYDTVKKAIEFTSDPARQSAHHAQQKVQQGLGQVDVAYNPNYIISLEVDSRGNVWCGTWGGGLARFDGETWRNYTTADGLPGNHIFMLYLDPDNTLWIGTSKGLTRLTEEDQSFPVLSKKDGLFADNVFSMAHAPDGSIWVGSFGGVARIQAAEGFL